MISNPRFALGLILILAVGYTAFSFAITNAPLLDLPNHITRAWIIGDLVFDKGSRYGGHFQWIPTVTPYLVADWIMLLLQRATGVAAAVGISLTLVVIGLPVSVAFLVSGYTRLLGPIVAATAFAFVLATDWFFLSGFWSYKVSMLPAVLSIACFERFVRSSRSGWYVGFVAFTIVGLSLHLSALIAIGVAVGSLSALGLVLRTVSFRKATAMCAPVAILLVGYLAIDPVAGPALAPSDWGDPARKLVRLGSGIVRFSVWADCAVVGLPIVLVLCSVFLGQRTGDQSQSGIWQRPAICAFAFVCAYVAMPIATSGVYDVDNRVVPYILLFGMIALFLSVPSGRSWQRLVSGGCVTAAAANLMLLVHYVVPQDRFMEDYRAIARIVPQSATIFTVTTHSPIGRYQGIDHVGAYATLDGRAVTPYLFAADRNPVFSYFRYTDRPYAPSEFWYVRDNEKVDWERVAKEYNFILVTAPFDSSRIPIELDFVAANRSAVLLRVVPPS